VYVAGFVVTVLIAWVAARSPVWVERAKQRLGKSPDPPPALEKVGTGEAILREWRDATQKELDEAEKRIDRQAKRISRLEAELRARGWDGRLP
jgi:flagellar motility protein MotE (MotC chaperone)